MAELLLTVEQTADRLQLSTLTVQRQLRRGALRGIKRGRVWRVPESALLESSRPASQSTDTPENRALAILGGLQSGDASRRNAAILNLAHSDAQTRAIVEHEVEKMVVAYDGPEDDLSDWRGLDGEPFQFPEEPKDYLEVAKEKTS